MGERRDTCRVLVGKPEERRPFQRLGVHGVIMKWICEDGMGA
jgi:hypothetical protein